jgi:hypothetical protein
MEFVCEVCDCVVYSFGGATQTRCSECELDDEKREHAERKALRDLLHDTHEKGRGARRSRDE